jgi:hypothetical protein
LEVMLTLPLAAPAVVGANFTENVVLCPVVKVTGKVRPLKLKPVPLALAAEMVRVDPPELVRVSERVVLLPSSTLPKARLVGLAVSVPCVTPVPLSEMLKLGFEAVEVTLILPLSAPAEVGAKSTENDALWPAVKVTGKVSPVKLKPVPLALAAEIVRVDPPLLVSVPGSDFEVPS